MQRQNSPSILLYSFGLALALSLAFNGFLLYEQSRPRSNYAYELSDSAYSLDKAVCQQQLSECQRANQQKDSLILRMGQAPNAPPNQAVAVQPKAGK
ncbi:hypothetical protein GCM10028807_07430 [Spirosoma daeguense]